MESFSLDISWRTSLTLYHALFKAAMAGDDPPAFEPPFDALPLPALERICAEVLLMLCPQTAGAFLASCKTFNNVFVGIQHQLTKALRAHEERGLEVPPFIARLVYPLAESGSLILTYDRLYVCIKAGSNLPSLAIYTEYQSGQGPKYSVATNMQLELLKNDIPPVTSFATQRKDLYAVSFSPITSACPPRLVFATTCSRDTLPRYYLLENDLPPGGFEASAQVCDINKRGFWTSRDVFKMSFAACLEDDLYVVRRKGSSPRYGRALPECFAEFVPAEAIMVGPAGVLSWFQAVGGVKIKICKQLEPY
jgi:hypothetical protein